MDKMIAEAVVSDSSVAMEAIKLVVCGSIGGVIVGGIMGALGKLWVDRKLERERANYEKELENLKAKLAQKHTIHKLQFEKEFSIYGELWDALIKLKDASIYFKPGIEIRNSEETPEQAEERKRTQFWGSYEKAVKLIKLNKPFYAKEVSEEASKLLSIVWDTPGLYAHFGREDEPIKEVYNNMKEAIDQMSEAIDKIEASVRKRIGIMGNTTLVE